MTSRTLALVPRDGLFLKDGRGWHAASSGRAQTLGWPLPNTVAGAVRALLGRSQDRPDWQALATSVRVGQVLALRRTSAVGRWEAMWTVPADVLHLPAADGGSLARRLVPEPPQVATLASDDDPAREALWRPVPQDKTKPAPGPTWWTTRALRAWLRDEALLPPGDETAPALPRRTDVRLAIDAARQTAAEHQLHAVEVLEQLVAARALANGQVHEWAVGVRLEGDAARVAAPVSRWTPLGGKGRLAGVEALDDQVLEPPEDAFPRPVAALRLLVVTPASFRGGWLPDGFQPGGPVCRGALEGPPGRRPPLEGELVLRAAFVPRPVHVSGWDLAGRRPRPTERMVPPGSVYVVCRPDGRDFSPEEQRAAWCATWGGRTEDGFGCVVAGAWQVDAQQIRLGEHEIGQGGVQ